MWPPKYTRWSNAAARGLGGRRWRADSTAASITRAREGHRSSRLFHFACVFFWQRALTLDFFHSEALHVRARQVSDSRSRSIASPTQRVRIFCIRATWRVFGGRIRERSPQLGARTGFEAPRTAALQHAEVNYENATRCQKQCYSTNTQCSYP